MALIGHHTSATGSDWSPLMLIYIVIVTSTGLYSNNLMAVFFLSFFIVSKCFDYFFPFYVFMIFFIRIIRI